MQVVPLARRLVLEALPPIRAGFARTSIWSTTASQTSHAKRPWGCPRLGVSRCFYFWARRYSVALPHNFVAEIGFFEDVDADYQTLSKSETFSLQGLMSNKAEQLNKLFVHSKDEPPVCYI